MNDAPEESFARPLAAPGSNASAGDAAGCPAATRPEPGSIWGPTRDAPRKPRRDDRLVCRVAGFEERGRSWAKVGSYDIVLTRAAPGALVEARVKRRRRDRVEADVMAILEPSPDAVAPPCGHFGECGGCSFQDLAYPRQLEELHALLTRELRALVPWGLGALPPVVGCESVLGYRNKMDFTFSARRWIERRELAAGDRSAGGVAGGGADVGVGAARRDDFAVGLHVRGRYDKVLDVERCAIQFAGGDALLTGVRELALASGLTPWDTEAQEGYLRHLVLRHGVHTGETMVHLVTSPGSPPAFDALCAALLDRHPEITTLVHSETERLSTVAIGERQTVRHGPGWIEDRLLDRRFRISADSFFQTNTRAAERLFAWVRARLAGAGAGGVLHDLYCGAGAIGLVLADLFDAVVGLEQVASAVEDARRNAALNGIDRATFVAGDVLALLAGGTDGDGRAFAPPDVVVVDPPRAGLHAEVVARLAEVAAPQLIYVSCNPQSAARDLPPLLASGYAVAAVAPFDLFPHTPHLECAFHLVRPAVGAAS